MSYLLEELDNWDKNKPITVADLKKMIEKSYEAAEKDRQNIEDNFQMHT
jgi:hypothetical protein